MKKKRHLLLGSVLLVSFIIGITAIIFFGSNKLLRLGYNVETYFDESVQGIEVGTIVKHRGVRVGVVDKIAFVGEEYPQANEKWKRQVLIRFKIDHLDTMSSSLLRTLIDEGLRTKIMPQGITGISYIDLDYESAAHIKSEEPLNWQPKYIYIPSTPSFLNAISSTISKLSQDINEAHLERTFADLNRILKRIRIELGKSKISDTVNNINGLVSDVRQTNDLIQTILIDNKASFRQTVRNLNKISKNLGEVSEKATKYPSYILFGDPPPRSKR